MSDDVLVRVEGVSKKFCRSLKKSLWYGLRDMAAEAAGGSRNHDRLRPDEFWAVNDVSLELRRGECLGLIGRNGAGKTTLLKLLNGLIKPDAGKLLCSPSDETPQPPGDARPDELEIARAIEAINEVTTLNIRHVTSSWAGLRNFVADCNPVVGFDPTADGFFWFAGQGGYGIQTAPALSRTGAALLRGEPPPADVVERGLMTADLAPERSMSSTAH